MGERRRRNARPDRRSGAGGRARRGAPGAGEPPPLVTPPSGSGSTRTAGATGSWHSEPVRDRDRGQQIHLAFLVADRPVVDDQRLAARRRAVRDDAHVIGAWPTGEGVQEDDVAWARGAVADLGDVALEPDEQRLDPPMIDAGVGT